MVKSTKASDPADDAALSAVEEALKIDFGVSADAPKIARPGYLHRKL